MPDPKYIFLIDDDSSAREGLARLLRKAGHDLSGMNPVRLSQCASGNRLEMHLIYFTSR
jgi:hypothetical protein